MIKLIIFGQGVGAIPIQMHRRHAKRLLYAIYHELSWKVRVKHLFYRMFGKKKPALKMKPTAGAKKRLQAPTYRGKKAS